MEALLLKRSEAAKTLALSIHSIDALIESHQLPVVRIGRSVRVNIADLQKFAAEGSPNRTVNGKVRNFGKAGAAK